MVSLIVSEGRKKNQKTEIIPAAICVSGVYGSATSLPVTLTLVPSSGPYDAADKLAALLEKFIEEDRVDGKQYYAEGYMVMPRKYAEMVSLCNLPSI